MRIVKSILVRLIGAVLIMGVWLVAATEVQGVTLTVTTNAASGVGSLAAAIFTANGSTPPNTITFNISGSATIIIDSGHALPDVTGSMTIDATTQSGYSNSYPKVWLQDNVASPALNGLNVVNATNVVIRGLKITGFSNAGISVGQGLSNRVEACQVISNNCGVYLSGAACCTVGSTVSSNINVISGSTKQGVYVLTGHQHVIEGNLIGVNPTNTTIRLPNALGGVLVESSWSNQVIGPAGLKQIISGNGAYGINILFSNSVGNIIRGNYVGLDGSGFTVVSNASIGVWASSAPGTVIGGTNSSDPNIIAGNGTDGIRIDGIAASNALVQGNYIGLSTMASPRNRGNGIYIQDADGVVIGGTQSGSGNIISGNNLDGIAIAGQANNGVIQGNTIGLNASASASVSNTWQGISFQGVTGWLIGGTNSTARNIIGGNGNVAIYFYGSANSNIVEGNLIGLDGNNIARPNKRGIFLDSAFGASFGNRIGGTNALSRNVISGNLNEGINLGNCGPNNIWGNYIGVSAAGVALSNGTYGVVAYSCSGITIGGPFPGQGNIISGNGHDGCLLDGGSTNNQIVGNIIGLDPTGMVRTPNGTAASGGITIAGNANTVSNNIVSGNIGYGINISSSDCLLTGNLIGLASNGITIASNSQYGISIAGTGNRVGGASPALRNIIGGNGNYGIYASPATNTIIAGNYIDVDRTGTNLVANQTYGLFISAGTSNTVGGLTAGEMNVIGRISIQNAVRNTVQGNKVGVDARDNGMSNMTYGLTLSNTSSNRIGGSESGAGNLIAGTAAGVNLGNASNGNIIRGNNIGIRTNGSAVYAFSGGSFGIYVSLSTNNLIGGTNMADGNRIAFYGTGVGILNGNKNAILGNLIYSNATMSIDLKADGIHEPIDYLDADTGANDLQNVPVITDSLSFPGSTRIRGYLCSKPLQTYRLEFFENDHGDYAGRRFLGAMSLATLASGTGWFTAVLNSSSSTGKYVAATATDPLNNTSEFFGFPNAAPLDTDTDHDGLPDFWEFQYGLNPNVSNTAASDADHDGMSDYREYLAGTNPADSNSLLRITSYDDQSTATVSFVSCATRVYDLYYLTNSLVSNTWVAVQTNIAGSGSTVTFQYNGTNAFGFYRVGVRIP